ncbi:MAG: TIGR03617 family F420-dependent LLM class oxidoreductase [Ilumatobacteraceae bacterium]
MLRSIDVSHTGGLTSAARNASAAEAAGCAGFWTAETRHDAFLQSVLALDATERLTVGTGIVIGFARSPMTIAQEATDLQDLSGGRFILGLGSQIRTHITKRFSMPWGKPVRQMSELIGAVRAIWAHWYEGARLDFRGEYYQHTFNSQAFRRRPAHAAPPPIHLAAVGPRMLQLAADEADGFISHSFLTERYLREEIVPILDRGVRARQPDFERVVTCNVVVDDGSEAARVRLDAVRASIALYGSTPAYRAVLDLHGLGALHEELHRLSRLDEWGQMATLIDDDVVDLFAVVGSRERVVDELLRRFGDVATRLRLPFGDRDLTADLAAKFAGRLP